MCDEYGSLMQIECSLDNDVSARELHRKFDRGGACNGGNCLRPCLVDDLWKHIRLRGNVLFQTRLYLPRM